MPATLERPHARQHRAVRHSRRSACVSVRGYGQTHRYSISKRAFENLVEDLEALSSPKFLASIRRARRDVAQGRVYTLDEIKRELDIR